MLVGLGSVLRRRVRGVRRRGHYPLLLPHFRAEQDRLVSVEGQCEQVPHRMLDALRLCDGTRTLGEVIRESGATSEELLRQHDRGRIVLWHCGTEARVEMARRLKPPLQMDATARAVIVSPHPDDAALSLGGMMLRERALILTLFGRSEWSRLEGVERHTIRTIRVAEEALAMRLCGAELKMLDLPDALSRGHRLDDVFSAEPDGRDAAVGSAILGLVGELDRQWPEATWYLPLGVGSHLDHRLAREIVLEGLADAGVAAKRVRFYEDQPYAAEGSMREFPRQVRGRRLIHLDLNIERQLPWKLELLRVYWSQFTWSRIRRVGQYARHAGGGAAVERVWTTSA